MRSDLLLVFFRNEHNIKLSLIRSSFRIHFFCELFQFGAVEGGEFFQFLDSWSIFLSDGQKICGDVFRFLLWCRGAFFFD